MKSYSSTEVLKILKADGWYEVACIGDHHQFKYPTKQGKVTITHPKKHIPLGTLKIEDNGILMLIEVFMPIVRETINNKYIKKTLTIPYWLNAEAENHGVNFSGTLQEALIQKLNLST